MTIEISASEFMFEEFPRSLPDWARDALEFGDMARIRTLVVERCLSAVFPEYAGDTEFITVLHGIVRENAQSLRAVLQGELTISESPLQQTLAFATVHAALQSPQAVWQRSYRVSFFTQWEYWATIIGAAAEARGACTGEVRAVLGSLSCLVQAYSDFVVSSVAAKFARSEEALSGSREHLRQRLLRNLLSGHEAEITPADLAILGYTFDAAHVAVLLPETSQVTASKLLASVREATGSRYSIGLATTFQSCVVWLAMPSGWTAAKLDAVGAGFERAGQIVCIGGPYPGLEGFRAAYEDAQQVAAIRRGMGYAANPRVLKYADVRLEILLLQDAGLARRFIDEELGPLALRTVGAARLRETLEASLRFGSHVRTAEHLQLHEHTVRNRLQKIEELLGQPHSRRTEILVALRLHRIFASKQDDADRHPVPT
ncbi:MAG: hypothetical protein JWN95_3643 [Frankiales bacterium]|nr:hypothetical protein [Frankiales bacterium]